MAPPPPHYHRRRQPLAVGLALLAMTTTATAAEPLPSPSSFSSSAAAKRDCPDGCGFATAAQLEPTVISAAVDFVVDAEGNLDCTVAAATKGTKWLCQVNNLQQTLWLALSCPTSDEDAEEPPTPPRLRIASNPACGSSMLSTNALAQNAWRDVSFCSLDVKDAAVPSTQRFFLTATCAPGGGGVMSGNLAAAVDGSLGGILSRLGASSLGNVEEEEEAEVVEAAFTGS